MSEKMTSQNELSEIKLVPCNKPLFHTLGYVRRCGGDKVTGGNSDGGGKNKQQSTKSCLPPRPRCRCHRQAAHHCRIAAAAAALLLPLLWQCCHQADTAAAKLPAAAELPPLPPYCR